MRTPLAWLNLIHERSRLVVAAAGVAFAVLLVFMNLGFLGALSTTASQLYTRMNGDVFLISPLTPEISTAKPFPLERLYEAAGIAGVEETMPLYVGYLQWRNPETGISRAMFFFGINPNDRLFALPELSQPENLVALVQPNTVLMDLRSRSEFGPTAVGTQTEVDNRRVTIGGQYSLGGGFAADGTVMVSDTNFRRYFERRPLDLIDLGVIALAEGADPVQVRDRLRQILPQDVEVFTQTEMVERERSFWINTTSTGFIFGMGVAVSLVVGAVIVYQILYADISDRLPEYATLKAMGYGDTYLFGVVLQEAAILGGLGYVPGFLLSLGLYQLTLKATDGTLPIGMNSDRAIFVFLLTIGMCAISACISLQKVVSADPAEVF
ncbi:ABC transporter permease DevC [Synechococcus sp. PCC 7336]|uniref:ABC transporter permease DevC n=1 Tax=Synechococcus sp. PCC 7336 TaxID=195250 RepID=UPI00035F0015|nr:ABC transporter permease DevC [Synechococcus sp. PCC 7336]